MESDDDFESFYQAAFGRIAGQLFVVTGDLQDAEDLTQEAFARASMRWSRLRTYDIRRRGCAGLPCGWPPTGSGGPAAGWRRCAG
jgi:Sigma-70 region 2